MGAGSATWRPPVSWLDIGAEKIIIGTAATPELLASLPRDRVIVAFDSRDGEVLSHGWRQSTGRSLLDRVGELKDLCDGFLITFVEREGQLRGTDLDRAREVIDAAGETRVTIAGGITTVDEIAALDRLGADAQVGMALYTGAVSLADAIAAPLLSERADGLVAHRGRRRGRSGTRPGLVEPGEHPSGRRDRTRGLSEPITGGLGQG